MSEVARETLALEELSKASMPHGHRLALWQQKRQKLRSYSLHQVVRPFSTANTRAEPTTDPRTITIASSGHRAPRTSD